MNFEAMTVDELRAYAEELKRQRAQIDAQIEAAAHAIERRRAEAEARRGLESLSPAQREMLAQLLQGS